MRSALLALLALGCAPRAVRVGSKNFTEGVILGEVATRACAATGATVEHRRQLGGTAVLWRALRAGEIDVYPEYTGTLAAELLRGVDARDLAGLRRALRLEGVSMTAPLGFNNTYALGVPEVLATARGPVNSATSRGSRPSSSRATPRASPGGSASASRSSAPS